MWADSPPPVLPRFFHSEPPRSEPPAARPDAVLHIKNSLEHRFSNLQWVFPNPPGNGYGRLTFGDAECRARHGRNRLQHQRAILHGFSEGADLIQAAAYATSPYRLTRPYVGFRPASPQKLAGRRIEPPVSLRVRQSTFRLLAPLPNPRCCLRALFWIHGLTVFFSPEFSVLLPFVEIVAPRWVSPFVDSTSNTPSLNSSIEMSNVPPRDRTRHLAVLFLSRP